MYAAETDSHAANDQGELAAQGRPPLVLVADDDEDFRLTLTHALTRIGVRVAAVSDGNALLDILGGAESYDHPDLVITDNHMPGCNGVTALEIIHASGMRLPAIVITGFRDEAMRADAQRFGAVAVMQKPIDLDELRQRIVATLRCA